MFLYVLITGKVIKLLEDSGATLSILSPDVFDSVVSGSSYLSKLSRPTVTANGSPLKTDGLATLTMQLGSESLP